jgi:hypothetical protein
MSPNSEGLMPKIGFGEACENVVFRHNETKYIKSNNPEAIAGSGAEVLFLLIESMPVIDRSTGPRRSAPGTTLLLCIALDSYQIDCALFIFFIVIA